jgi:hypothetical protein
VIKFLCSCGQSRKRKKERNSSEKNKTKQFGIIIKKMGHKFHVERCRELVESLAVQGRKARKVVSTKKNPSTFVSAASGKYMAASTT